jgi:hypothetical protein
MRPAPHPRTVQLLAVLLYLAIIAIGFAGTALGHGLIEPLLAMMGLGMLIGP